MSNQPFAILTLKSSKDTLQKPRLLFNPVEIVEDIQNEWAGLRRIEFVKKNA